MNVDCKMIVEKNPESFSAASVHTYFIHLHQTHACGRAGKEIKVNASDQVPLAAVHAHTRMLLRHV